MLQESPDKQFHQGILQGETSGAWENQQVPSHFLTQKLPVDHPSLASSSLKLPCKETQCRRITHFPGFLTPHHFQQHSAPALHKSCSSKWLLQKVSFIWRLEHLKIKSLLPNSLGNPSQNITFFCATAVRGLPNKSKHWDYQ